MTVVFCECYVEVTAAGTIVRRAISVNVPTRSSNDVTAAEYSCDVCVITTVGSLTPSTTKSVVTGATPQRALGQALLRVDSLLYLHSHLGLLRREESNERYEIDSHSAIPRVAFENAMQMREAMREDTSNVALQSEQLFGRFGKPR